jgi:hypothetical protein
LNNGSVLDGSRPLRTNADAITIVNCYNTITPISCRDLCRRDDGSVDKGVRAPKIRQLGEDMDAKEHRRSEKMDQMNQVGRYLFQEIILSKIVNKIHFSVYNQLNHLDKYLSCGIIGKSDFHVLFVISSPRIFIADEVF